MAPVILEKLKASQTCRVKNHPKLFEWGVVGKVGSALACAVSEAQAIEMSKIPTDATEEDIMEHLKTGNTSSEFKPMYLWIYCRDHKFQDDYNSVVVLSRPEHMDLYDRLVAFLGMPLEYNGTEIFHPKLWTEAIFLAKLAGMSMTVSKKCKE